MDFNENVVYSKPYYEWIQNEPIGTLELYDKFVNWVSGEFDLNLQEESDGLKVYCPEGWFKIKRAIKLEDDINMEIAIVSKSKEFAKE